MRVTNAIIGHVVKDMGILAIHDRHRHGARAGLFIVGGQRPYYNVLKAPNYLSYQ
jgi:hypothetical protein